MRPIWARSSGRWTWRCSIRIRAGLPAWKVAGAALLLAAITAVVLAWRRRRPYLLAGWLWYLGMLVPVIGLVQVGEQAMADRYTYLTQIGLYIALAWACAEVAARSPRQARAIGVAAALGLAALTVCTWRQTTFWQDSETLWTHALKCTTENVTAHNNLGNHLLEAGRFEEAIDHFRRAVDIMPECAEAHNNLGNALAKVGQSDEAIVHFHRALDFKPDYATAYYNLGSVLADRGRPDEAIRCLRTALEIQPGHLKALNNLGNVLAATGRLGEAVACYRKAVEFEPAFATAHFNLSAALRQQGNFRDAVVHLREAARLTPTDVVVLNRLAWVLATCPDARVRNGAEAVALAQRAAQLSGGREPLTQNTLAAAYAEAGRFREAVQTAAAAVPLASAQRNNSLRDDLRARLRLYAAGSPCRDNREDRSLRAAAPSCQRP